CTQTEEGAKFASLDYEIKDFKEGLSLAEINLHTGRTHQIRVQTAAINAPVYGDMRYGGEKAVKGKLALWAYSLRFTHPVTGEHLRFIAEPPKDTNPWKLFDINLTL
ncbi:MAG: RNA pseudouridine synthase, partial [Clostridia bacterium]|nr:RNA pseudouridine synthase [Clostridia bacterium]